MSWIPKNLSEVCAVDSKLSTCQPPAMMFLALIANLFGQSRDDFIFNPSFGYSQKFSVDNLESLVNVVTPNYGFSDSQFQSSNLNRRICEGCAEEVNPRLCSNNFQSWETNGFNSDYNCVKKRAKIKYPKINGSFKKYDFIIVGAGSAGCVLANRLSEIYNWKILLLEAGIEEPEVTGVPAFAPILTSTNIDWQYQTQPDKFSCRSRTGQVCAWARGKIVKKNPKYHGTDHATLDGVIFDLSNKTSVSADYDEMVRDIEYYQHSKSGRLSTMGPITINTFIQTRFEESFTRPDIQYSYEPINVEEFYKDPIQFRETAAFPITYYNGIMAKPILLAPRSRGLLRLNFTEPIWGGPEIYPNFFTAYPDLDTLIDGIEISLELLNTQSFIENGWRLREEPLPGCIHLPFGTRQYWACIHQILYSAFVVIERLDYDRRL
ncbi:hypothetical protein KQX54_015127 [Cotesia glomerata]|uniref:Uncharacterized protein n=1 Tax=Cotesia glomerata TaxID=32391 RepID=A0AAV7IWY5_COTGL|nr:hypothetical protein KQX54_015127 [Cotesia glomerata]